jgi:hypothetical protein
MTSEALYRARLARYVTAMRNEVPDLVPIRPFVAEFTARYAGSTGSITRSVLRLAPRTAPNGMVRSNVARQPL